MEGKSDRFVESFIFIIGCHYFGKKTKIFGVSYKNGFIPIKRGDDWSLGIILYKNFHQSTFGKPRVVIIGSGDKDAVGVFIIHIYSRFIIGRIIKEQHTAGTKLRGIKVTTVISTSYGIFDKF